MPMPQRYARTRPIRLSSRSCKPGTPDFDAARNQIIHNSTPGPGCPPGAALGFLNEGSGQYTFKNSFADLTVGAAYRQFLLGSDGSLFEDTKRR